MLQKIILLQYKNAEIVPCSLDKENLSLLLKLFKINLFPWRHLLINSNLLFKRLF